MRRLERWLQRDIDVEEDRLRRSWAKHSAQALDEYLVSGYQNPRINAQSILARHFLVSKLFGPNFDELMRAELSFCVAAHEKMRAQAADLGVEMGSHTDESKRASVEAVAGVVEDEAREFEQAWTRQLRQRHHEPLSVLELACGSANDYRFFDSYGIARFLDYTGVDLNPTNVANARARFPGVRFEVANILELPFADDSMDYVVAFDVFEHLSLSAMELALSEAARVARHGLVLAFFIMVDSPDHRERPRGEYHWNELSASKIEAMLASRFASVTLHHIPTLLAEEHQATTYYNKKAWTVIAEHA